MEYPIQPVNPTQLPSQSAKSSVSSQTIQKPHPVQILSEKRSSSFSLTTPIACLCMLIGVAGGAYYFGLQQGRIRNSEKNDTAIQVSVTLRPTLIASTLTPQVQQSVYLPPQEQWFTYTHSQQGYTISYPPTWKVTAENYNVPAGPMTNPVYIFNPADDPQTTFYSGMIIRYLGSLQDTSSYRQEIVNGVPMFLYDTQEGEVYIINIPDTDQYIQVTGAGGHTANEETNQGLKQVFASLQFKD